MDAVLDFVVNILSTPAILVGLLSLLGLALQGKPIEDIVTGTVKTIVGFLVLEAGSSFLQSGSLNAFGEYAVRALTQKVSAGSFPDLSRFLEGLWAGLPPSAPL